MPRRLADRLNAAQAGWRLTLASAFQFFAASWVRFLSDALFSTTCSGSFLGSFRFVFGSFFMQPRVFNNFPA
jgi:hypothetical protein